MDIPIRRRISLIAVMATSAIIGVVVKIANARLNGCQVSNVKTVMLLTGPSAETPCGSAETLRCLWCVAVLRLTCVRGCFGSVSALRVLAS